MTKARSAFLILAACAAFALRAAEADLAHFLPVTARCAVCVRADRILALPGVAAMLNTPASLKFQKECELDYGIRLSDIREALVSADADGRNAVCALLFSSDDRLKAVLQDGSSWLQREKDGSYFVALEGTPLSGFLCRRAAPGVALCYESGGKKPTWTQGNSFWYQKGKNSRALAFAYANLSGAKRLPEVLSGVKTARADLWESGKNVLLKGTVSCRSAESAKELKTAVDLYYAVGCSFFAQGNKQLAVRLEKALKMSVSGDQLSAELSCDPLLLYHLLAPFLDMAVHTGGAH